MRESVRLYIKEKGILDSKYLSLVFVASTRLLDKNFVDIDNSIKKLMDIIENA